MGFQVGDETCDFRAGRVPWTMRKQRIGPGCLGLEGGYFWKDHVSWCLKRHVPYICTIKISQMWIDIYIYIYIQYIYIYICICIHRSIWVKFPEFGGGSNLIHKCCWYVWGIFRRNCSRWWFQMFFMFTPIWGRFPFWLWWVDTSN